MKFLKIPFSEKDSESGCAFLNSNDALYYRQLSYPEKPDRLLESNEETIAELMGFLVDSEEASTTPVITNETTVGELLDLVLPSVPIEVSEPLYTVEELAFALKIAKEQGERTLVKAGEGLEGEEEGT